MVGGDVNNFLRRGFLGDYVIKIIRKIFSYWLNNVHPHY